MPAPEGAQLSPDGNYWWDEQAQQWQLVQQDGQPAVKSGPNMKW